MKILIKKLQPEAKLPAYALPGDAGMDLYSVIDATLAPGEKISCPTGIAIKIPEGYVGLVWDKSGLAHKSCLTNIGGVYDSNYTGEYIIGLVNLGKENYVIKKGQKIAQLLIQKIENPEIEIVENMPATVRGEKRFGSTGLN
ncbi:MAG TPA: dUTP diphosphatase [Candidatus Portnoybacteria bacterium]|nr:dUTP diphosphatase [Candidatus Portnoybacteria bacterium]